MSPHCPPTPPLALLVLFVLITSYHFYPVTVILVGLEERAVVCTCVQSTSFQDSAFFIDRERRCGGHVTIVRALWVLNSRNLVLNKLEPRELYSLLNPKKSEQACCRESRAGLVISDPDAGIAMLHLLSLLLPALCLHSLALESSFLPVAAT